MKPTSPPEGYEHVTMGLIQGDWQFYANGFISHVLPFQIGKECAYLPEQFYRPVFRDVEICGCKKCGIRNVAKPVLNRAISP